MENGKFRKPLSIINFPFSITDHDATSQIYPTFIPRLNRHDASAKASLRQSPPRQAALAVRLRANPLPRRRLESPSAVGDAVDGRTDGAYQCRSRHGVS